MTLPVYEHISRPSLCLHRNSYPSKRLFPDESLAHVARRADVLEAG